MNYKPNPSLGIWVQTQQYQFKDNVFLGGDGAHITPTGEGRQSMERRWKCQYKEMVAYKTQYGNCKCCLCLQCC
jgi:hypothetical protein